MTDDDLLTTLVRGGERHAHKVLIERREKSLGALFHLIAPPGGNDALIPCGGMSKELALAVVKAAARNIGAVAVLTLSEAWMQMIHNPSPREEADMRAGYWPGGNPPSQSSERIEVVLIAATDGKRVASSILQIVRDKPGGRIVALVPHKTDHDSFGGQMIEGIIPTGDRP